MLDFLPLKLRAGYEPNGAEVLREFFGLVALSFGIADAGLLRAIASDALELALLERRGSGLGLVVSVEGSEEFVPLSDLDRLAGIVTVVNALAGALMDPPAFVGRWSERATLLAALRIFRARAQQYDYCTPPKRGGRPGSHARFLARRLAERWRGLTGEEPTAWTHYRTGEGGGRFYALLCVLCRTFKLYDPPPSPASVRRWLAAALIKSPPNDG